jgi:hypothetical protein
MNTMFTYIPSQIESTASDLLRQHSFTRWMSRDLMQAATDFCKNIGLHAIYAETAPDGLTRYLFWKAPQGSFIEIRSGRTRQQFEEFDQQNIQRDWSLLSLHINERDIYSATWISAAHFQTASAVLKSYGITPAERRSAQQDAAANP